MTVVEIQESLKKLFLTFTSPQIKYEKIIEMGQDLPPFSPTSKIQDNLVEGCQSLLYLETYFVKGMVYFNADSEALISRGLAALLIKVYSGHLPEDLFKYPPYFIQEIGLPQILSPSRSNGLASLYLKMQREVLRNIRPLA